ncbi:MAG: hypothetical protein ABJG78_16575 [Cyclobacteriaceae bacterium]
MITSTKFYESKIVKNQIAYWKFLKGSTPETFMDAFEEFNTMITNPKISSLLVNVEMDNAWGREIQDIWIKTGDVLDQTNIKKWAVVTKEVAKELTIKHLIKGAGKVTRSYDHFVGKSENEAIKWLMG